ncbi:hypothetical protein [Streptomyces sp. NPDC093089]|uniref:hypothetical protein n=1 Tax=Streptomyces sp. NPDC093089 TaxID=3366024 RepID=UPI00380B50F5
MAVALGAGFLAFSKHREEEADYEDVTSLTDGIASLLSSAITEQDSSDPRLTPQYVKEAWEADDYERDTCLNPRLHPHGCTHERRQVARSTRKRRKDLLTTDS